LLSVAALGLAASVAFACELTMGYRESAKLPYMAKAPDNQGFYLDLYRRAAERIGCRLDVVRKPKKRIFRELATGEVDFYPLASFSEERAVYLDFFSAGFSNRLVGISRADLPTVTDLSQLDGVRVVASLGASFPMRGGRSYEVVEVPRLNTPRALALIRAGRADFYIYDLVTILGEIRDEDMSGLKLHHDCCRDRGNHGLGTLLFARASAHYQAAPNPDYDARRPLAPDNLPEIVDSASIAGRFRQALLDLEREGMTPALHQEYIDAYLPRAAAVDAADRSALPGP
jgi:hypothetical protein